MDKKYTLDEIILEAVDRFQIEDEDNDREAGKVPERLRKKFDSYVHTTKDESGKSLWELAEDRNYPEANNKSYHFFTEEQKEHILSDDIIFDYLIKRSKSEAIKSQHSKKSLQAMVDKEKEEWIQTVQKAGFPSEYSYFGTAPSGNDILNEKNAIMLEALFELFFEPINEKQLSDDMLDSQYYGGDTETKDTLLSKIRHSDYHNYYTSKKEISKELDAILDIFADKVAERITAKMDCKAKTKSPFKK